MAGVRNFGSPNADPRAKRAYAHTMVAKARQSGSDASFAGAVEAVTDAGTNSKAKRSNFGGALASIAIGDQLTSSITNATNVILDPANSAPYVEGGTLGSTYVKTGDFTSTERGVVAVRFESYTPEGDLFRVGALNVTDHGSSTLGAAARDGRPYNRDAVPMGENGQTDVVNVRLMPEERRQNLASLLLQIVPIES